MTTGRAFGNGSRFATFRDRKLEAQFVARGAPRMHLRADWASAARTDDRLPVNRSGQRGRHPRGRSRVSALLAALMILHGVTEMPTRGQARLHVDVAERERWYGEDNLYGEQYGRRVAMHGEWLVAAGVNKAVVWRWYAPIGQHAGQWNFYQHIDLGIGIAFGAIADVAVSDQYLVFGVPRAHYTQAGPRSGKVFVYQFSPNAIPSRWTLNAMFDDIPSHLIGYETHFLGTSVAVVDRLPYPCEDEVLVMVGAPDSRECCAGDVDGPGFVFLMRKDRAGDWWIDSALTDDVPWRHFGASLDYHQDGSKGVLLVGAPRAVSAGPNQFGVAHLYESSGSVTNCAVLDLEAVHGVGTFFPEGPFDDGGFGRFVALNRLRSLDSPEFAVAANGGVLISELSSPLFWINNWIDLPGRTLEGNSNGIAFDFNEVLYLDGAGDEVVSMNAVTHIVREDPPFFPSNDAGSPRGLAMTGAQLPGISERIAVGYPLTNRAGRATGMVTSWVRDIGLQELTHGGAEPGDKFGASISAGLGIDGAMHVLVGAPGDAIRKGAVYRYDYEPNTHSWIKAERWRPSYDVSGFGTAVAYGGPNRYAAGAPASEAVIVRHPLSPEILLQPPSLGEFGTSLAYQGERLMVGAPETDDVRTDEGAVYAYEFDAVNGWSLLARLTHPSALRFGQAVALDGDWLIVGAPSSCSAPFVSNPSTAYIYRRGLTWELVGPLERSEPDQCDSFGATAAIRGNVAVVGAPKNDAMGLDAGAVFWFERDVNDDWLIGGMLTAADGLPGDEFGARMAFVGENLFVTAPGVDPVVPNMSHGATYAFRRTMNGWVAAGPRIPHANPTSIFESGLGVAAIGDFLLVGDSADDAKAENAGTVIVFEYHTRVEVPSPLESACGIAVGGGPPIPQGFEPTFEQRFGSPQGSNARNHYSQQIAVSGDTMAVGERSADVTWGDPPQTYGVGAVHVYRRTGIDSWTLEETIVPPLDELQPVRRVANFGFNVALDGPTLAVVAHNNSPLAKRVYLYQRQRQGWALQQRVLRPPVGGIDGQSFGREGLALSGNTLMVGENNFSNLSANPAIPTGAGAVWFFERESNGAWILNAGPLHSSQAHFGQHLGFRVAVDGPAGRAVATGDRNDVGFRSTYLFERIDGTWRETTILNADSHGATIDFGQGGLDIEGDTLIVGDHRYVHPQNNRANGGVFVWTHDGAVWNGPEVLVGSEPGSTTHGFGGDADLDGNLLVVGARYAYLEGGNSQTPQTGVLYVFGRENGVWTQRLRLPPGDPTIGWFGEHVAVSGGIVAAGTTLGSGNINYQDAVFTFDLACSIPPCPGDINRDSQRDLRDVAIFQTAYGLPGSFPPLADLNGDGVVDGTDWRQLSLVFGQICAVR